MDKKNAEEIGRSRADMYRFLASIYLVPAGEHITALFKAGRATDAFEGFLAPETVKLLGELGVISPEDLRQEFYNLFAVPTGQYTTPFEAVFRDGREVAGQRVKGLMMGPSTLAVMACYRRAGAKNSTKELPDHVGCELGFMGYLCSEEAHAARAGLSQKVSFFQEEEREFLRQHLSEWMPSLAKKIEEKAKLNWYKALSKVTVDFIRFDLAQLEGGG